MNKEYKIETRPTIYHITVSSGEYSDYSESHYFLRANDLEEAQFLFKRYWKDVNVQDGFDANCLVFKNGEHYNPFNKEDPDWSSDYGDAQDVDIEMLDLICFQEVRIINQ